MKAGFIALALATPGALSSCQATLPSCEPAPPGVGSEYALVEYRLREETDAAPKVQISDTDTYRAGHASYGAAALRLPDACAGGAAAAPPPPHCSHFATEIERALGDAGIRVIAADAVLKLEREKALSTYGAAKELGADVVFVINSLEAVSVAAGTTQVANSKIYSSDASGTRGAPLVVDADTSSAFLGYTRGAVGKEIAPTTVIALSSVVDATAIVTKTGESIWFYRRAITVPTAAHQGMRFLFGRVKGGRWTPAAPIVDGEAAPPPAAPPPPAPAPDGGASPEVASTAGADDAKQRELMAAGATELVAAFRSGSVEAPSPEAFSK